MGRHSHPDDDIGSPDPDPGETADALAVIRAAAAPANGSAAAGGRPGKTSAVADLQLVLHDSRLLATCLSVALAPFVCYFAVITAVDEMHVWAIFVGAPLVLAGILVGAVLDRAYAQSAEALDPAQRLVTAPASAAPAEPDLRSVEGAHP